MRLKREIGFGTALFLSINAILGTGIYFLPGIAAGIAGPASLISWILVAFISIFISFYFAELVSLWPRAGGIYEFTKRSFGQLTAFIIGWAGWIISNVTIAMLMVGSLLYLIPSMPVYVNMVIAISFILFFNFINYIGIRHSARMLLGFGAVAVMILISIILFGLPAANMSNLFPFFVFPFSSVFLAMFFIAEVFFGWEAVTYLAEEIKSPRKILPKTLISATCIIAALAISLVFVCLAVAPWSAIAGAKAPLVYIGTMLFGAIGGSLLRVVLFFSMIGAAACWIISSPRLLFAMARDKLFISDIQRIHPKYKTPHIAILFQTIVSCVITMIAFGSYRFLLSLLLPLAMVSYTVVLLCVVKLRLHPLEKKYFKAPFGLVGPPLIILFNAALLVIWLAQPGAAVVLGLGFLLILVGFPAYIIIKLQTDLGFIEKFWDRISFAFNWYFPFLLYSKAELKKVLSNAELSKRHIVLDYGCGTGITTVAAAKLVKRVVAVDLSKAQIAKALKKAKKEFELSNIIFVKMGDPKFGQKTFDRIICTLAINYFVNPEKELYALARTLKPKGIISALAILAPTITTHRFLKYDRTIETVFKRAGFSSTKIERKKKLGREYIYIKAQK